MQRSTPHSRKEISIHNRSSDVKSLSLCTSHVLLDPCPLFIFLHFQNPHMGPSSLSCPLGALQAPWPFGMLHLESPTPIWSLRVEFEKSWSNLGDLHELDIRKCGRAQDSKGSPQGHIQHAESSASEQKL